MKFSFKPIVKQKKIQRKVYTAIINYDDKGTLCAFIEINGLIAVSELRCLRLSEKSLSLKGKKQVYLYDSKRKKHTIIIRSENIANDFPGMEPYLPFRIGSKCKGTIKNNNGINEFEIVSLL